MARIDTLGNFLTDVATAIKDKTGKTEALKPADFDTEIASIISGEGAGEVSSEDLTKELTAQDAKITTQETTIANISEILKSKTSAAIKLQYKQTEISSNGIKMITPDDGYDGLARVVVTTNIDSDFPIQDGASTLNATIQQTLDEFCNRRDNLINTYPVYTSDPVTLYTPVEGYNYYLIRKRATDSYGIVWFNDNIIMNRQNSSEYCTYTYSLYVNNASLMPGNPPPTLSLYSISTRKTVTGYVSPNYTTIDECLAAIQNPETVYTSASNYLWGSMVEGEYSALFSNLVIMDYGKFALSQRISGDETFKVIPSTEEG